METALLKETSHLQETSQTYKELLRNQARLATGNRIQSAKDDPSGLIASERFRAILEEQEAAKQNLNIAQDLVHTTDSALSEVTSLIREGEALALQASNSFVDDDVRQAISFQLDEIRNSINRIASNTEFGGTAPLGGSLSNQIEGTNAVFGSDESISLNQLDDLSSAGLGLSDVSFASIDAAIEAQTSFDDALSLVLENRGRLGGLSQQIETQINIVDREILSNTESLSRYSDTDYIREASEAVQNQTSLEASYKVIQKRNEVNGLVGRVLDLSR